MVLILCWCQLCTFPFETNHHCHLSKGQLILSIRMKMCNPAQPNPNVRTSKRFQQSTSITRSCISFIFAEIFQQDSNLYLFFIATCMQWPCLYISRGTRAYTDIFNSFQWYARPGGANHWWEKSPTCPSTHLTGTSLSINLILMTWLYYTIYAGNLMKWVWCLEIGSLPQTF